MACGHKFKKLKFSDHQNLSKSPNSTPSKISHYTCTLIPYMAYISWGTNFAKSTKIPIRRF